MVALEIYQLLVHSIWFKISLVHLIMKLTISNLLIKLKCYDIYVSRSGLADIILLRMLEQPQNCNDIGQYRN